MKAHQRLIREIEAEKEPREVVPLDGCRVEAVDRSFAEAIILRYEWLGTMPIVPVAFYGLVGPQGEPLGVSCFGYGSGTAARGVCGPEWRDRTIILERGACVHYAHEHAASFLTSRAVEMCAADHGHRIFIAYSDAEAGEIGTVYQATNWLYLGHGNGRHGSGSGRWYGRVDGGEWMNSRRLRAMGLRGAAVWAAARQNPRWQFRWVPDRARYVTFEGNRRERKEARKALRYPVLPYPKR